MNLLVYRDVKCRQSCQLGKGSSAQRRRILCHLIRRYRRQHLLDRSRSFPTDDFRSRRYLFEYSNYELNGVKLRNITLELKRRIPRIHEFVWKSSMRELRLLLPQHLFEFLEHNQLQSLSASIHSNLGDLDRRSRWKPLSATILNLRKAVNDFFLNFFFII